MSFEALRQKVEMGFLDGMPANFPDALLDQSNVDYGANRLFSPPLNDNWVRVVINPASTLNAEIGANFQRTRGVITVQCFAPIKEGENELNRLVDGVTRVFQNKKFGNLECYATELRRIGVSENWYQFNAVTEFKFDVFSP